MPEIDEFRRYEVKINLSTCAKHIEDCEGWWSSGAQWQSTGGSSQRYLGSDSQWLLAFSLPSILSHNI